MKIIAVMSPKGGIGKTTTSDSIAYILGEEQHRRVLILEGDQQGDTSETFGCYEPEGTGMSELLEQHERVGGRFRTSYLMKTDMNILMRTEDNQILRLRNALEEVANAYDYCICDCGRLFDMVVINILMAAEVVIVPVKVGGFEVRALNNLAEQIDDLRQMNPALRIKVILTMRQKNKTSMNFEEWLKDESDFDTFITPVRRSVIVEKAAIAMQPLPKFSPKSIASQDYRNVVHELVKEMEGRDGN